MKTRHISLQRFPAVTLPTSCMLGFGLMITAAHSAVIGPYASDANTLALYHFTEAPGAADPGNPIANSGTGGTSLNLTNTGGPDGRNNTGVVAIRQQERRALAVRSMFCFLEMEPTIRPVVGAVREAAC